MNEQVSIAWVLQHIPSWVSEVVLVDGLSTDMTEAYARAKRPDLVVVHQHERGKGAALRAGFAAASGDIVAMLDADGSTDPRELHRFVEPLLAGVDLVKGSRTLAGAGSVDLTPLRRAGNAGFVTLVNLLYRAQFTDLCYGYCAFWRRHLDALALTADGFDFETELAVNALAAGLEILEVPSVELARRGGASNLHAFRDGRVVLRTILRHRFNHRLNNVPTSAIELLPLELASHQSDNWLPAGHERRRYERRRVDRATASYEGAEHRRGERRTRPEQTVMVYLAVSRNGATKRIAKASVQT